MAEPILQGNTPTVTADPSGLPQGAPETSSGVFPKTSTGGFDDPNFFKQLEAAFQARDGAAATPPASPATDEGEGDVPDPLTPPPKLAAAPAKPAEPAKAVEPTPAQPQTQTQAPPVKQKAKTTKEQWAELHRLRDDAEARAKAMEERYKQLEERAKGFDPEEIKRIRGERDDFERRLKAFAVEHDPQFEAQMSAKFGRLKTVADSVLGDKSSKFMSLLQLPEGEFKRQQIAEAAADMDEYTRHEAFQLASAHREIAMERAEYLKNASENYQKILDAQARQAETLRNRVISEFESTVKQWQDPKTGIPVLQTKEGDDAWNSQVTATIEQARNILTGNLPGEELVRAAMWSAVAPRLLQNMQSLNTRLAELQAENAALKAAGPDPSKAGSGAAPGSENEDQYKGLSYAEAIARRALDSGAFAMR